MEDFVRTRTKQVFESSEEFKGRVGIFYPEIDPIIIDFFRTHAKEDHRVLEIGGGSGFFLDLLLKEIKIKSPVNLDYAYETYRNQVNKDIRLVGGDALNSPFEDKVFDWIIVRNVLRHVVGKTRTRSVMFARKLMQEAFRVAKDGAYLVILEQFDSFMQRAWLIFYVTLILSLLGIKCNRLGYAGYAISFLSPREIEEMLSLNKVEIVVNRKFKMSRMMPLERIFSLGSDIGRILVVGKVKKG